MKTSVSSVVAIFLMTISIVTGLTCYSCESREDEMCGRDPTRANRVTCTSNELCNVLRTERSDSFGRTVTISRGCRQSAFAGAVGGNGVGMSTTSQSCSTDLCNTGDGLGPSINFPGFNSNNFGFGSNNNGNQGGFQSTGNNGGFQSSFNRPGAFNSAPTRTNYNPLLLLLTFFGLGLGLGLVSSIVGMNV